MRATRVLSIFALIAAGAALLILLAAGFSVVVLAFAHLAGVERALGIDTQSSKNYDFVSGSGPMFIAALGFSGIIVAAVHRWNCHEPGCWRHGKYQLPSGVNVCDRHHPDKDSRPKHERGLVYELHVKHHERQAHHLASLRSDT